MSLGMGYLVMACKLNPPSLPERENDAIIASQSHRITPSYHVSEQRKVYVSYCVYRYAQLAILPSYMTISSSA